MLRIAFFCNVNYLNQRPKGKYRIAALTEIESNKLFSIYPKDKYELFQHIKYFREHIHIHFFTRNN